MQILFLVSLSAFAQDYHGIQLLDRLGEPMSCAVVQTTDSAQYRVDQQGWIAFYEPGWMNEEVWFTAVNGEFQGGFSVLPTEGANSKVTIQRNKPNPPCELGADNLNRYNDGLPASNQMHTVTVFDSVDFKPAPAIRVQIDEEVAWTDNNGIAAFYGLPNMSTARTIWFEGAGFVDTLSTITPTQGGSSTFTMNRNSAARRVHRLTGSGRYNHSELINRGTPVQSINTTITSQTTAESTVYNGELFTVWANTTVVNQGDSMPQAVGGTAPFVVGTEPFDYDYFATGDAPKALTPGSGATLSGLISLGDGSLWASYRSSEPGPVEQGIATYSGGVFSSIMTFAANNKARPGGPANIYIGEGTEWVVYSNLTRAPSKNNGLTDATLFESYTALSNDALTYDDTGELNWQWRAQEQPFTAGLLDDFQFSETPLNSTLGIDNLLQPVIGDSSVAFNPYRGRFTILFVEHTASDSNEDVWYAEADTPVGPWSWAKRIYHHQSGRLTAPHQHIEMFESGGQTIYFEGTFSSSEGDPPVPRYENNQMLYELDLDSAAVPVAFYESDVGPVIGRDLSEPTVVSFGAWDQPIEDAVAVYYSRPACDPSRTLTLEPGGEVAFYGLDLNTPGEEFMAYPEEAPLVKVWPAIWRSAVPLGGFDLPLIAAAGPDQCDVEGFVSLNSTASSLQGVHTWRWGDNNIAVGEILDVRMQVGTHVVTLTVEGADGVSTDTMVVSVLSEAPPPEDTGNAQNPGGEGGNSDDSEKKCGCEQNSGPLGWACLVVALWRRKS